MPKWACGSMGAHLVYTQKTMVRFHPCPPNLGPVFQRENTSLTSTRRKFNSSLAHHFAYCTKKESWYDETVRTRKKLKILFKADIGAALPACEHDKNSFNECHCACHSNGNIRHIIACCVECHVCGRRIKIGYWKTNKNP